MGAPIDYVIFEGMDSEDANEPVSIILADIKSGKASLSIKQRRIAEAVLEGRVSGMTYV